jgi:hypothetical protein
MKIAYTVFRNSHIKEGKAISVIGHKGPSGFETSRFPHFVDNGLKNGGEVVRLMRRQAALYPPGRFLVLISVRG